MTANCVSGSVIHQSICLQKARISNCVEFSLIFSSDKKYVELLNKRAVPALSARMLSHTLQLKSSYPAQEEAA